MKLTELEKTATSCWAPMQYTSSESDKKCPMLVTGTVAGAFDASFSATCSLELFAFDLQDSCQTLELGKQASTSRFNKLGWSEVGAGGLGTIAGGREDGSLNLYNPQAIINKQEGVVLQKQVHSGQLQALDFNPLQQNLLATGASQAEIFIWDMNNTDKPYSPGQKSQKLEDITCLQWNRQVQHILASASTNGNTVVWDLKNKREIIHLSQPSGKKKVTAIAWNPDQATQILTASDDDLQPVIYMWDLRNAHAPEKVLSGHSKGVLSIKWCPRDSGLMISGGKDDRLLCWNPSEAKVIGEFPSSTNWIHNVDWCLRNPELISSCSFDGRVSVYSISSSETRATASNVSDDPFANIQKQSGNVIKLKQPPKWLQPPVICQFGFGNKLITSSGGKGKIKIQTIVGNQAFVECAKSLDSALSTGDLHEYCQKNSESNELWKFLSLLTSDNVRPSVIKYLGVELERVHVDDAGSESKTVGDLKEAVEESKEVGDVFEQLQISPHTNVKKFPLFTRESKDEDEITKAVILGEFKEAVDRLLRLKRFDEALIMAINGGDELIQYCQREYYRHKQDSKSYLQLSAHLSRQELPQLLEQVDQIDQVWKELLSLFCTFSSVEELPQLSLELSQLLPEDSKAVDYCLLLSGSEQELLCRWLKQFYSNQLQLHDLISLVLIYRKINTNTNTNNSGEDFEDENSSFKHQQLKQFQQQLVNYSVELLSQGQLDLAFKYLSLNNNNNNTNNSIDKELLYRLYKHLNITSQTIEDPFNYIQLTSTTTTTNATTTNIINNKKTVQKPLSQQPMVNYNTNYSQPIVGNNTQPIANTINQPPIANYNQPPPTTNTTTFGNTTFTSSQPPLGNYNSFNYQQPNTSTTINSYNYQQPPQPQPLPNTPSNINSYNYQQPPPQVASLIPQPPIAQQQSQVLPPAPPPTTTTTTTTSSSSGGNWNDPPLDIPSSKKKRPAPQPIYQQQVSPIQQPQSLQPQPINTYQPQQQPPPPQQQQQQQQQQPVQQIKSPIQQGHPVGDRSHIPGEHLTIFESLSTLINNCKPNAGPPQRKALDDVEKRCNILFDKLNNEQLSADALKLLLELSQFVIANDFNNCLSIQQQLMTVCGSRDGTNWILGLRRLFELSKQLLNK